VFSKKKLQTIENKGSKCEKLRQERKRGCKLLKRWDLPPAKAASALSALTRRGLDTRMLEGDTPGVLYGCEYKGVAGEGFCKFLKTKARQKRKGCAWVRKGWFGG
jgi:hypothetical protein